jgi:hypothetical protein
MISLKEGKVLKKERFWRLYRSESRFSLKTVWTAKSSVRTPVTESQSLIPVRTAHQTQATKSSCLLPIRTAQQTRITESTCLQGCSDTKVKTMDGEPCPYNRLDARSSHPFSKTEGFLLPVRTRDDMSERRLWKFEFE